MALIVKLTGKVTGVLVHEKCFMAEEALEYFQQGKLEAFLTAITSTEEEILDKWRKHFEKRSSPYLVFCIPVALNSHRHHTTYELWKLPR